MSFTPIERFLHFTALPVVVLVILLSLLTPALLGRYARRLIYRRRGRDLDQNPDGPILGAALGMLALLMGFLFAMAIDRFDQRRAMVVEEANAISATYLMAQTFENPYRSRITGILATYVNNRVETWRSADLARTLRLVGVGQGLQSCLWTESLSAVAGRRDDVSSQYLQAAHELIETGATREAARRSRIPPEVYIILLLIAGATTGMLAFALSGTPTYAELALLLMLVTAAIALIIDLDRPMGGRITESQFAMERLQARIAHVPQQGFGAPLPPSRFCPAAAGSS